MSSSAPPIRAELNPRVSIPSLAGLRAALFAGDRGTVEDYFDYFDYFDFLDDEDEDEDEDEDDRTVAAGVVDSISSTTRFLEQAAARATDIRRLPGGHGPCTKDRMAPP